VVLWRFLSEHKVDLDERFQTGRYLTPFELESLRDFLSYNFDKWEQYDSDHFERFRTIANDRRYVVRPTLHNRLTVAAGFLSWYAEQYYEYKNYDRLKIKEMVKNIKAQRPTARGLNSNFEEKALSDEAYSMLHRVIGIESRNNPFSRDVRERNRLLILLQDQFGIRSGELLNLKISDFNFDNNKMSIIRRADEISDTRKYQPLVKTNDRELDVADWLIAEVHRYILGSRQRVKNSQKCPYLFVTFKSGGTQGQPLSISGYKKIWEALKRSDPLLSDATAHRLRHTWNDRFSETMDNSEECLTEAKQEAIRSRAMGWQDGSGTARHYNRRFITKKANQISVKMQNDFFTRLP
jgi:integrase